MKIIYSVIRTYSDECTYSCDVPLKYFNTLSKAETYFLELLDSKDELGMKYQKESLFIKEIEVY